MNTLGRFLLLTCIAAIIVVGLLRGASWAYVDKPAPGDHIDEIGEDSRKEDRFWREATKSLQGSSDEFEEPILENPMHEWDYFLQEPSLAPRDLRPAESLICRDLYRFTCSNDDRTVKEKRQDKIDRMVKRLQEQAMKTLAGRHGFSPATEDRLDFLIRQDEDNTRKWQRALMEYYREIDRLAAFISGREGSIEFSFLERYLHGVQEAALKAVDQNVFLNPATKEAMQRDIRRVKIQSPSQYFDRNPEPSPVLLDEFRRNCGGGNFGPAFVDLAYTIIGLEDNKIVVPCPGLLISLSYESGREKSAQPSIVSFERLAYTLAHELSHHIGYDFFPQEYSRFLACTGKEGWDWVLGRQSEVIADYWAAEILAQLLMPLDNGEIDIFMRSSLFWFCAASGGLAHPTGRDRIRFIIGRHPALRRQLGCPLDAEGAPSCTLGGYLAPPAPDIYQEGDQ